MSVRVAYMYFDWIFYWLFYGELCIKSTFFIRYSDRFSTSCVIHSVIDLLYLTHYLWTSCHRQPIITSLLSYSVKPLLHQSRCKHILPLVLFQNLLCCTHILALITLEDTSYVTIFIGNFLSLVLCKTLPTSLTF